MKIALLPKINQQTNISNYSHPKKGNNVVNSRPEFQTPIFKGAGTFFAGKVVSEVLISGVNASQLKKFKKEFVTLLKNIKNYSNVDVATMFIQLSKTSNSLDENLGRIFTEFWNRIELKDLKKQALEMLPKLDDKDSSIKIAKKCLINSMIESGEYAQDYFANNIRTLPNEFYGAYKQELADKVLYTPVKHRLANCPEQFLYNYKLIEALDDRTGFHEKYLINNIESIKNLCSIANAMARKQLTSTKNYAFAFYSHNFICDGESYVVGLEKSAWRDSLQNQFMQCLKASEGNSDKLAKNLNIDKELAIEIIKDQEALSKINSTDNVNQKYQIFDNRMREKLNTHVKVLSEDWFEGKNEYRNLRTRFYGYLTFAIKANKLGIKYDPDRLNKNFEKELKNLCKKIDEKAEDRNLGNVLQDNQIQDFLDNNYILQ